MSKKIQTEFEEWRKKVQKKLSEEWIEEVTLEAETYTVTFSVDLDYSETFQAATLIVPESYPKGMYNLCFLETISEFKSDNLALALDKCIKEFENHREALLESTPPTSKSHVEDDIFDEPAHEIIIDDDTVDESHNKIEEAIKKDIEKVQKTKGWYAELGACSPEQIRIYLFLDPRARLGISDLVASAWRIDLDKYITIALTFSGYYLDTNSVPTVDAYQSGNTSSSKFRIDSKLKFGLYWTVEQRMREDFFKRYWPIEKFNKAYASKGLNYMQVALEHVEEVIKQSPGKCIICGSSMPFVGIKPTVCEKNLCIFSHEQYGLGIDLESAIKKEPDLVDLMISMSYSASEINPSTRYNPFNPYPYVEVKVKNIEKGIIETHNCLNSEGKPDNQKAKELLDKLPSVSKMSKWVDEGKLKDNLDKVNPLLYSLLRWILASNRSHLKKMSSSEQLQVVKTDHQYLLMSSPPEKEKRFQELKKQYGSFHAWHGSALCNWHSIMRIGLKNMSGTAGQVNGAAYGSGIYLAENSSVSFGYMRYQTSWKQSVFGSSNVGCLALCEVVNHPCLKGMPNPYYVVANEDLVQTRYFFVYTGGGGSVNVSGKSIKVPSIKFN